MKYSHMTRLYISNRIAKDQMIILSGDHYHYLKYSVRLKPYECFRIFNENDGEFAVKIQSMDRANITIIVESQLRLASRELELTLAICIIKSDRMLEALKSAVQLGVTQIIPMISERVQNHQINTERFTRAITSATEQSERFNPPILHPIMNLSSLYEMNYLDQIIFACESESEEKQINNIKLSHNNLAVLIGPEGGFTENEIAELKNHQHINSVSLGSNILRAEVASTSAIACINMMRNSL